MHKELDFPEFRVPDCYCPCCRHVLNVHISTEIHGGPPRVSDWTVCGFCLALLIFVGRALPMPRKPTFREKQALRRDRETWQWIERVRAILREANAKRRKEARR